MYGAAVAGLIRWQVVEAQQPDRTARVVLLNDSFQGPLSPDLLQALRSALSQLGWMEGKNLNLVYRYADTPEQRADIASELSHLSGGVIVATPAAAFYFGPLAPGVSAARNVPAPINAVPIVFVGVTDPVAAGMVKSLARPGGTMTGLSYQGTELVPKRLELLKAAVPHLTRVAVLSAPGHPLRDRMVGDAEVAALNLALEVKVFDVPITKDPGLLDVTFARIARDGFQGVLALPAAPFFRERARIAALALKHKLPLIFDLREYVEAGALLGYAPSASDLYRRAAGYVDRILRGASPADMPIEQPTKFELVINLKTARSLGLTIPPSLLLRADEVIE